jgi:hypothetical protein
VSSHVHVHFHVTFMFRPVHVHRHGHGHEQNTNMEMDNDVDITKKIRISYEFSPILDILSDSADIRGFAIRLSPILFNIQMYQSECPPTVCSAPPPPPF